MATFRQLVYMVLDEIKGISDDFTFTEEHILFLLGKYRNLYLQQAYTQNSIISDANYQTICLDIQPESLTQNETCNATYLRSINKIPDIMMLGTPKIYSRDLFKSKLAFVPFERLRYAGFSNKFLRHIIYCAIGPDKHLYFRSNDARHIYLKNVKMEAIFNDTEEAAKLNCAEDGESNCDILDNRFPCEDFIIPQIIKAVVTELTQASYKPKDPYNNANDDIANIQSFIRTNMKERFLKQQEGE